MEMHLTHFVVARFVYFRMGLLYCIFKIIQACNIYKDIWFFFFFNFFINKKNKNFFFGTLLYQRVGSSHRFLRNKSDFLIYNTFSTYPAHI